MVRSFPSSLRGRILARPARALRRHPRRARHLSVVDPLRATSTTRRSTTSRNRLEPSSRCSAVLRPLEQGPSPNAQVLAQLLGTGNTGVKIVDRRGAALADHAVESRARGAAGAVRRHDPGADRRCARRQERGPDARVPAARPEPAGRARSAAGDRDQDRRRSSSWWQSRWGSGKPVGYAVLGRPLANVDDRRARPEDLRRRRVRRSAPERRRLARAHGPRAPGRCAG